MTTEGEMGFEFFTEHQARKVGTTRNTVSHMLMKLRARLPAWFRIEPGFRFLDDDGDTCIVLGPGGYRDVGKGHTMDGMSMYELDFKPAGFIVACLYKGEWHLFDMSRWEDIRLAEMRPAEGVK